MKSLLIICLFLVSSFSWSQSQEKDYLEKLNRHYFLLTKYEINMSYKLYKGHKGNEVIEEYTAFFAKNGNTSYNRINNIECISFDSIYLQLDHQNSILELSNASKVAKPFDFDMKLLLSFCSDVTVDVDKNNNYVLTLKIKNNNDIPYSQVRLMASPNHQLKKVEFFFASKVNYGTYNSPVYDFPKLVIEYEPLKKKSTFLKDLKLEDFILFKTEIANPSAKYAKYTVKDYRLKTSQP